VLQVQNCVNKYLLNNYWQVIKLFTQAYLESVSYYELYCILKTVMVEDRLLYSQPLTNVPGEGKCTNVVMDCVRK